MFERNRTDNRIEPVGVPVELETNDGALLKGKLKVPSNSAPLDALNAPGNFIEFEPYGGEPAYIAKATLAGIRLVGVPRSPALNPRGGSAGDFDPHVILGISTETTWDEVRQAYHRLSKTYHPDLYSTTPLPPEVAGYLETMARRINAAYAALEVTEKTPRRSRGVISEPVFTSAPRG